MLAFQPKDHAWIDAPEMGQLNEETRRNIGGSFINLKQGHVFYELTNRNSKDLVVFIHGYSSPSFVWDRMMPFFDVAGLSTLRFDLYGHGFSDRPNLPHNRELFRHQLQELIHQLAPNRKLHLVAWSMGAMVAAEYTTANPDRVKSTSFVSPSGLPIQTGFLGRVALIPGIGDLGFSLIGGGSLHRAQAEFFEDPASHQNYMKLYKAQTHFKGFKRSMLSTLREMDMDHFHQGYRDFARSQTPTWVVWSVSDKATPFKNSGLFKQLVPHATLIPLNGVGHASQYEKPELIAPQFIQFIQKHSGKNVD